MATVAIAEVVSEGTTAIIADDQVNVILVCSQAGHVKEWCEHKAVLMQSNADAKQFDGFSPDDGEHQVTVPLFPTRDINVRCTVVPLHSGGMSEVSLVLPNPDPAAQPRLEHLGILTPGEGRLAIRTLIVEWLRFQYEHVVACRVSTHSKSPLDPFSPNAKTARRIDNLDSISEVPALIDTLSLLSVGACSKCAAYLDPGTDIPEV